MKKIIQAILMALPITFVTSLSALAQHNNFTIKGKIGSWSAPATIYLRYMLEDKPHMDSVLLHEGRFELKGKITGPTRASLFLSTDGQGIRWPYDELFFYIDRGVTFINGADSARKAVATGTKVNLDLNNYNRVLGANKGETDEGFIQQQFVKENPDSYISLTALYRLGSQAKTKEGFQPIDSLCDLLTPALKNTNEGKKLARDLANLKALSIGLIAPGFSQPDTNGIPVALSSFRGKYVLIDFWASWCKPCRAESKNLVQLFQTYKDKNFTIVGVSLDRLNGKDKWLKAIHDDQLTWTQVSDLKTRNEAAGLYQVNSIPSYFLIDPIGRIIGKDLQGEQLADKLKELL